MMSTRREEPPELLINWRGLLSRTFLRLAGAVLVLALIGVVLVALADGSWFMIALGWALIALTCGFTILLGIQRVAAPNPAIVLDREGLHDKRLFKRPVPWSAFATGVSQHSSDPTVFVHLRANRRHLAERRSILLTWPQTGLSQNEAALVLSPLEADAEDVIRHFRAFRDADLEQRIPVLQSALNRVALDGRSSPAFDTFVETARDCLFLCPMIEGAREFETFYGKRDDGASFLDLFSDEAQLRASHPDLASGVVFLANEMAELIGRGVAEIRFDPGSEHALVIDKSEFAALLPRL